MRNGSRGHFRLMIILIDARPDPIAFFSLHNHQDRYTTITALSYPQRTLLKDLASSCLQSVDVLTLEVEAGKVHQATLAITGRRVIIQKGPAEPAIQTSVLRVRTPLIGKILVLRVASGRVYLRLLCLRASGDSAICVRRELCKRSTDFSFDPGSFSHGRPSRIKLIPLDISNLTL